jgi:hypothetical protein
MNGFPSARDMIVGRPFAVQTTNCMAAMTHDLVNSLPTCPSPNSQRTCHISESSQTAINASLRDFVESPNSWKCGQQG